jgi:hypothetical protein
MTYGGVPYDRLSFKASHNSYDRDEDIHLQLAWDLTEPGQSGCRGLEFDINRHSDTSGGTSARYFQVSHDQGGEGPPLAAYLGYLLSFHCNDQCHDPVLITLDIKSEDGAIDVFPVELDTYLGEWFDTCLLLRPAELLRDRALDLCANVARSGWPPLDECRGRFIFCLSGTESWKAFYAGEQPFERLCFADVDVADDDRDVRPLTGHRAIANMHVFSDDFDVWRTSVRTFREARQIVRAYEFNSSGIWSKGMAAGVNVLATDQVRGHGWAGVGPEPFAMLQMATG